ncbi:hypothetical protein GCM10010112_13710 [Actinoplanes lobatus]|uniref:Plasmid stabilization system protein ParE n=1 Tax=Actinoplanes lobatus TaxID=113568 RepID=A0A7W7HMF8_9ACTN|nr:hypothetical protein [Actinoplanes lobatus]MBB4753208.1 plasmid stabilization system protein ParE [Actinoplanes lobatus]GGN59123.1 hypothetical protein GCM10010112_13710 [Actinoplanes lobatus]GIE42932.1 hypothetical protein Alo02nite_58300 [Actinoplanes lobatus]
MIDAIGEAVAGHVVERALTRIGPALIFWTGGALAWLSANGGWEKLVALGTDAAGLPVLAVLAVVALVLAGAYASTTLVTLLTRPVLRLLEGYWPRPLRRSLVKRNTERQKALSKRLSDLEAKRKAPPAAGTDLDQVHADYARSEARWRRLPSPRWMMPTRLGNMLRAAETRPFEKYGLDTPSVWPHLWDSLPDPARADIGAARSGLDRAVAAAIWSLAFVSFTGWSIWALPIGLALTAWAVLLWAPYRAARYADLLEAAFDVHRTVLYRKLRWPLPTNPDEERETGRAVTTYLVRGLAGPDPTFTTDAP